MSLRDLDRGVLRKDALKADIVLGLFLQKSSDQSLSKGV